MIRGRKKNSPLSILSSLFPNRLVSVCTLCLDCPVHMLVAIDESETERLLPLPAESAAVVSLCPARQRSQLWLAQNTQAVSYSICSSLVCESKF